MTVVRRGAPALLFLVVIGLLFAFGLPKLTGANWRSVEDNLELLTVLQLVLLVCFWLLGLYSHTFVATAAMPSLSHRRALALNLSGSAVSNLLPLGGALGMGLTYAMVRSWGHARSAFASYTALTTFWNVATKLALPVIAVGGLAVTGDLPTGYVTAAAVGATGILVAVLLLGAAALLSERAARVAGDAAQRVVDAGLRLRGSSRQVACTASLLALCADLRVLLRRGWRRMVAGMTAYSLLQVTLLWLVLQMFGSNLGVSAVFAGFAFGRLLSLLVLTPGGVGVADLGSAALLVALGGEPGAVAAATLLYTAITFVLEIPVGGVCGLVWWRGPDRPRSAT
ncbi:MAG: lysylphosphatidylglycerol synthase domain-containing protein [Sporichthyaceae bacterium]